MITEKIFCKACGQKIDTSFLSMISGKKFVELDDGYYCQECARDRIKKRREKMK